MPMEPLGTRLDSDINSLEGSEHGPHGIILGPDGLYFMSEGNHTFCPKTLLIQFQEKPFGTKINSSMPLKDPEAMQN